MSLFRKLTAATATATIALGAIIPAVTAEAGSRHGSSITINHGGGHMRSGHRRGHRSHRQKRRGHHGGHDAGALIAAGIFGLAVGAIIADNSRRRHVTTHNYVQPRYSSRTPQVYRQPLPEINPGYDGYQGSTISDQPQVLTYQNSVSPEPWTREWYAYCNSKYRSFNSQTGTFLGYDGRNHFCQ